MNYESHRITWNASSLNIIMLDIQNHVTYSHTLLAIINIYTRGQTYNHRILETHTRPIPTYKLFLNSIRDMHQIMTYKGYRVGLLMLIHNKHAYPNNLSTVTTHATISPFLQIFDIANQPLQP